MSQVYMKSIFVESSDLWCMMGSLSRMEVPLVDSIALVCYISNLIDLWWIQLIKFQDVS